MGGHLHEGASPSPDDVHGVGMLAQALGQEAGHRDFVFDEKDPHGDTFILSAALRTPTCPRHFGVHRGFMFGRLR